MVTMSFSSRAKLADEFVTRVTVHHEGAAMAGTLHGGLLFEGYQLGGSGGHILYTQYLVAAEVFPLAVCIDTGRAEELGALLAVNSS